MLTTLWLISKIALIQVLRYGLLAGGAYLIVCKWGAHFFEKFRIQKLEITSAQIKHELKNSVITSLIFGFVFVLAVDPHIRPYTKIYNTLSDQPMWWNLLTLPYLILFNDAYFYWMHRAVHHKRIFKWVHHTHHVSINPTPLASFSFHPLEAILESIWIVPLFFLVPLNFKLLIAYSLISFLNNIRGHLSVDLLPVHLKARFPLNWINTSRHHSHHHKYFNTNYGLYFMFWDRWCGTERAEDKVS